MHHHVIDFIEQVYASLLWNVPNICVQKALLYVEAMHITLWYMQISLVSTGLVWKPKILSFLNPWCMEKTLGKHMNLRSSHHDWHNDIQLQKDNEIYDQFTHILQEYFTGSIDNLTTAQCQ